MAFSQTCTMAKRRLRRQHYLVVLSLLSVLVSICLGLLLPSGLLKICLLLLSEVALLQELSSSLRNASEDANSTMSLSTMKLLKTLDLISLAIWIILLGTLMESLVSHQKLKTSWKSGITITQMPLQMQTQTWLDTLSGNRLTSIRLRCSCTSRTVMIWCSHSATSKKPSSCWSKLK